MWRNLRLCLEFGISGRYFIYLSLWILFVLHCISFTIFTHIFPPFRLLTLTQILSSGKCGGRASWTRFGIRFGDGSAKAKWRRTFNDSPSKVLSFNNSSIAALIYWKEAWVVRVSMRTKEPFVWRAMFLCLIYGSICDFHKPLWKKRR